ncbi:hypothetical protein APSETT445_003449 [Aspergillus pseudonomiae]
MAGDHPAKRIKLCSSTPVEPDNNESLKQSPPVQGGLASLHRSITPPSPPSRRSQRRSQSQSVPVAQPTEESNPKQRVLPSPFQLTHIRDLAASSDNNVDTVRLRDVLGDPLIRECWQFNYLHDVDFIMSQFDEDVRRLVKVKVVHGSWKRDAPNRVRIDEACSRYPNVEAIVAYMPEAFEEDLALGSGARFKRDLLAYLGEYGPKKTGPLVNQLRKYDFGAIRAALVASVPSKQKINDLDSQKKTLWGWPALKDITSRISPAQNSSKATTPHIVTQYMRPYLRHWAGDHDAAEPSPTSKQDAGRRRAAPHIKTYIRFSDAEKMDTIDWAMVTSANLSTQAWGAAVNTAGEVRICSWEIGVMVWPQLYAKDVGSATMVPSFKRDTPESLANKDNAQTTDTVIGLRMPYDLPLTPYTAHDMPWCATAQHSEPDWLGQTWTLD